MPKILHFAHSFFPIYGGTTTRLYNLLSNEINEHYLYIPQVPYSGYPDNMNMLREKEVFGNIKVRRCKLFNNFKHKIPVINKFRYIKINSNRLVDSVKEGKFGIVYGHNPLEFATAAMKYAKKNKLPFLYETHGLTIDEILSKKRQRVLSSVCLLVSLFFKLRERKIFHAADLIITQTEMMKERLTKLFNIDRNKIKIIPNGVDKSKFDPVAWDLNGKELRKERGWNDKIIFMYSGFLDDINGIEFFLNNIIELPENIKRQIKVLVIGRGPLQKFVEDVSKEERGLIEYNGLVNYNEMPMYYSACDVFVVPRPSTLPAETLIPMKLLEAMAMEKIVLGSNVAGITEVVMNSNNGVIFQKGDREDLFKKVGYIVQNITKMDNVRKQARRDVVNKYSWEESRERLQNIYEKCYDFK